MRDDGNLLLYVLSAWRQTSWAAFKNAFDQAYLLHLGSHDLAATEATRYARFRTAAVLDALGHCDVHFDAGAGNIYVAPPTLAVLPLPGMPRAVLCGSRSPDTVTVLSRTQRGIGARIRVTERLPADRATLSPSRVEVHGESHEALARFAGALGIAYADPPPAWSICKLSGSLSEYLTRLEWRSEPEINWDKWNFDPHIGRFSKANMAADVELRLSRYTDPSRPRVIHRLWRGSKCADVDPAWGRFAVLNASGKRLLTYDAVTGTLRVPQSVPLPRLLARAATLCSGDAPRAETIPDPRSEGRLRRYICYSGVPADVLAVVAAKVGQ